MLIAVYGTLRKGCGNYHHYLGGYEPIETTELNGFQMYSLGGAYPYVTEGEGQITVELYDVPFETVVPMASMEMGAGYSVEEVPTSIGTAYMFVFSAERHQQMMARESGERSWEKRPPRILSGNWIEWLAKYRPERMSV
jgi:gamma-glutamylcyclotransferase (GGCT)/AIG2-like uncharacterized protein YtfP